MESQDCAVRGPIYRLIESDLNMFYVVHLVLHEATQRRTLLTYESEAPMNVGATQTPSFDRILCTLFVAGFTQAASLESSVINPISRRKAFV